MIKIREISRKILNRLSLVFILLLIIISGATSNALGGIKERNSPNDIAVVVKEDGLWKVNLSKLGEDINLDKKGVFKSPRISPEGKVVAYTKDGSLYIVSIDSPKGDKQPIKISDKIVSYSWADKDNLVYSTEKGGLSGFNLKSKKSSIYINSENRYEGIEGDRLGTIYSELYRYYTKDGQEYIEHKGVISYDLSKGEQRVVVPSKPISEDDLGLTPRVAGISKDGAYVYIWRRVHSASINSDGVPLGVYEVKSNNFKTFDDKGVFALSYSDNLTINPLDGSIAVLNNGGLRNMNINKTLVKLNARDQSFTPILPDEMIASNQPYGPTTKGMVTMTPSFSPDGKKIIFAASNTNEDASKWLKEPHNIYSVDIDTKKVEKLTKGDNFDFYPIYISKGRSIVFARLTGKDEISLYKLQDNKEESIVGNISLRDENGYSSSYYGHYNLENVLDIYVSN
ncbi:PD40 domain-containing protein [Clostridium cylindrosporum]|uniref:Peptidase M56, BlaR1 n=1 Tax=Clostridium cylindrosporum DSM 605 TaxID=1121307 RepID=A0A0J8DEA2_CLOCY|nr:PD40 domain-containing protein [Clostridium cylindrosporum]KMT22518.1 peptidase M56, BlaR1 [Clostridium cylindrosporum DSM 605]